MVYIFNMKNIPKLLCLFLLILAGCSSNTAETASTVETPVANETSPEQDQIQEKTSPKVNPKYTTVTTEEEVTGSSTVEQEGLTLNTEITLDTTTTVNCGEENCFNEKFKTCEEAELTVDVGFGSAFYNIMGMNEKGCEVSFVYLTNPNPAWENQPMTCTLDNTVDFQTVFQAAFTDVTSGGSSCTGPLVDILQNL